ncbi:MAG: SDR family NAD(P)-dependent oxidoreductase [Candidatus Rokuibacteriota bacterium]
MMQLRARVGHAVVVGASSGVGKLVADALAAQGVVISTVGRTKGPRPGAFHKSCADLATLDWAGTYAEMEAEAGAAIDAVVYVAGDAAFGRAAAVPVARARRLFEANFWGPAAAATAADRLWAAPRRGAFVSVSSIAGRRAVPFEAHYCASKAASARFLEALGLEHPDGRVRFVSVYPGRLKTAFRTHADWHGTPPDPAPGEGSDPAVVARSILEVLAGRRGAHVIGARENAIDLADRLSPRLYDRLVLGRRVRAVLARSRRSG